MTEKEIRSFILHKLQKKGQIFSKRKQELDWLGESEFPL